MDKNIKIAVTGVGGGVGQSIVKGLYDTDYTIVGLDVDSLAAALYAVPVACKILSATDPNYIENLLKICKQENCKLLFPGLDTELEILSKNVEKFKKIGTTVVISTPKVIENCDNKLLTYQLLSSHNVAIAKTYSLKDFSSQKNLISFPIIIKPMIGGSRSKDVYLLNSEQEFDWLVSKPNFNKDNFIVQEYIGGEEYTCGTVNLDEKCWGVIVMKRVLRNGDTYKCFTIENKIIEEAVLKVMEVLKPFGACNVQLRFKKEVPTVFEINARCSGTTGPRALAGFNEPKMIADYLIFGKEPSFKIKKVSILRYWKEIVVENEDIEKINTEKNLLNKEYLKL